MAYNSTTDDGLVHDRVHNPQAAQIPVPHGPETGTAGANLPYIEPTDNEKTIFNYLLRPDDSYTPEGVYWADLGPARRIGFVNSVNNADAAKELRTIGSMVKRDPLSPVGWYLKNAVLPGAGLGLEGYVLFSIGNLSFLFQQVWPACWKTHTVCSATWVHAVDYLEVVGIIVGQVLVGVIGDWLGRRWGLIQDAAIMLLGLVMLTAAWGIDLNGWVICYAWSLFIYGVGVGGEYPMTATAAMENSTGSGRVSTKDDRLHRGRKVTTAFLMQGWGQFWNQTILIIALLIFNHRGTPPYSDSVAQWTYRVSFAIPALGTLWLVYHRAYKMPLASKQLDAAKKKTNVTGYDTKSLGLTFSYFGSRVLGTAGTWFCNDVFFYGNKLFQGTFITTITGNNSNVMTNWLWNMCNIGVSLAGYYLASFLIDNKLYGRKWMMQVGFALDFILFMIPAFNYEYYTSPAGIHSFQAMYFLSSFFNQFGPNCVTFLTAAESYPTPVRATAHGFSAAVGKLGALLAAILYNYITQEQIFKVVPWFGLAGMLLTLFFIPDTTGLDLKEQERRWKYIREGRESEYHGVAVHPHHLSLWERLMGAGRHYAPELDYASKIEDMRAEWVANQVDHRKAEMEGVVAPEHDDEWNDDVHSYFSRTTDRPLINGERSGEKARSDSDA